MFAMFKAKYCLLPFTPIFYRQNKRHHYRNRVKIMEKLPFSTAAKNCKNFGSAYLTYSVFG